MRHNIRREPSLLLSLLPVAVLLAGLSTLIVTKGADAVQALSHYVLLAAAAIGAFIALVICRVPRRLMKTGLLKSAGQVIPVLPILLLIATVSATWMLSGVVPTLIIYGVSVLNPAAFLFTACAVCAVVSVMSGSSWTTIATIGVAFLGIGTVWGFPAPWIAGAVISGAYFGDKVSPLSDTTVLASSTCGVELFAHIRNLMITSGPAMIVALIVFFIAGLTLDVHDGAGSMDLVHRLADMFNITPWTLLIPVITFAMIIARFNTALILGVSTLLGVAGIFLFQPAVVDMLRGADGTLSASLRMVADILFTSTEPSTGSSQLDSLISTGGIEGMLPTVYLVLSAMMFGGVMMGSGMLSVITHSVTRRLRRRSSCVSSTVATGIILNGLTGDQYLSIIINGNLYRNLYRRNSLPPRLLSRTVEDSTSVTSVLIPWNSCALTQSAVLGVSTFAYLPYCLFNILSPLMSLAVAWGVGHLRSVRPRLSLSK